LKFCDENNSKELQLEVITVVLLKTPVFWDVTLCHWVSSPQNFKGCLHL